MARRVGPGKRKRKLFEEFRQVGGLGLALSRKFVTLHGGRIGVESALGRGATFTFTRPLGGPPAPVLPGAAPLEEA